MENKIIHTTRQWIFFKSYHPYQLVAMIGKTFNERQEDEIALISLTENSNVAIFAEIKNVFI